MIRILALIVIAALFWAAIVAAVRFFRERTIDWSGVAFAAGFVVLAFWLHHVTGAGQLFG